MKLWSQYFIPTLKESPADAEIPSHKLLIRAGLVRKLGGGLYTYLPLGLRVMQRLSQVCREELERAGAIELAMPHLHPAENWQQGPRWAAARVSGLRDQCSRASPRRHRASSAREAHGARNRASLSGALGVDWSFPTTPRSIGERRHANPCGGREP